jgi:hypothetical protein
MGYFYGRKIKNKEINKATGESWSLDDVPERWKAKTEQWLDENE